MEKIKDQVKYMTAISTAALFMAAAYYLPAETFIGFFAAILFVVPMAFVIYAVQQFAKGDRNKMKEMN